jgi:ABC-type phosphate transport system substrate-binding protein
LVVAPLAVDPVPAAPLADVAPRHAEPEPQRLAIVVGHAANHVFDLALRKAFAAAAGLVLDAAPDLHLDRDAVELVQLGRADFAVCGGSLAARDQHAGLHGVRIGVELFALAVAPDSPARSLTHHQVRQVLTGRVQRWTELGLAGGAIAVVVPSDRALADRAAKVLIPGDPFASTCVAVASEQHAADQLLREPGAVAVVRVTGQPRVDGLRLLQIDWVTPSADAFAYTTYPYGVPIVLVTHGPAAGAAADFLAFVRSADGNALLARTILPLP